MDSVTSILQNAIRRAARLKRRGGDPTSIVGKDQDKESNDIRTSCHKPQKPGEDSVASQPAPRESSYAPLAKTSDRHRQAALDHIRRGHFGRAQRELEEGLKTGSSGDAAEDLRTLRAVRRCHRLIDLQPSNPIPHLELGRCYLELDLADEAMRELREASRLAPSLSEPHVIIAIEHLYSSRTAEAEAEYDLATAKDPSLPPFSKLLESVRAEHHMPPVAS